MRAWTIESSLISLIIFTSIAQPIAASVDIFEHISETSGPFLDSIEYHVIESDEQQILALYDGEIDLIGGFVDPMTIPPSFNPDANIEVANTLRNGYGYFTINCEKYPLNITALRRAFAFALDKQRISAEVWEGLSLPLDSPVPAINPYSIEGQLPYNYYEANIAYGNQLLDVAGFLDIDDDDYREAPDGSAFKIQVGCSQASQIYLDICTVAVEALESLSIDAISSIDDFYPWPPPYSTDDYDIWLLGATFSDFDVDWLAYEYWSYYADDQYRNFPRWSNASYDSWREQLLHSLDYDEVYEAAVEMQKIWVYECPAVICYENIWLSAYRTEKLSGFVNDAHNGVSCWWTNYRAHLKESEGGPFGGTMRISNPLDVDTFNFMSSSSQYTWNVLQMLYDSLLRQEPGGTDFPWFAESYFVEAHADNPAVTEGHTRITFEILENITWTDGSQLTADDVTFSLNYYHEDAENPYGLDLADMTAAYAPNPYQAVVEFENESYWYLHNVGYKPIIPKHVFQEIGSENWNLWNPIPPNETMITSGPFKVSRYEPSEIIELTKNLDYFRVLKFEDNTNTTNIQPTTDTIFPIPLQHIFVTIPSVVIIIVVLVKWSSSRSK
ncbi:MAG: ABC transporter substrate-binding protein [Candidatus Thorarchaeota archaeon]